MIPIHVIQLGNNSDALLPLQSIAVQNSGSFLAVSLANEPSINFQRGDANQDGLVNLGDAVRILDFLFGSGAPLNCPDAADFNGDATLAIDDAVVILDYLFVGSAPAVFPGPNCGFWFTTGLGFCSSSCP